MNNLTSVSAATTEAATVAELAHESERYGQTIVPDPVDLHVDILERDQRPHIASHEQYLDEPRRPRGLSQVTEVASFVTLLGMTEHFSSVIFATEHTARLTSVVNYHGWRDHRVVLQLETSEQWARWSANNQKLMSQTDFAELIEDGLADIIEPDSADMLELAQTFEATKSVDFQSGSRLKSGAVSLRWVEAIDAKAGRTGDIEVPTQFVLMLPIWRGGEPVTLRASLRYRIGKDGLRLGYKLLGLDDILRTAFLGTVGHLTSQLDPSWGHYIVFGSAPEEIRALP
ncbi:DUF2303 family protein [Nocardia wallacei]|uniref:DUF2303 family protein n=1 Tax=Nocardia wallacei TaxID=480035 RepID=UPI0024569B3F|nr:DUF2303 family protein [Nocardia wallacei]